MIIKLTFFVVSEDQFASLLFFCCGVDVRKKMLCDLEIERSEKGKLNSLHEFTSLIGSFTYWWRVQEILPDKRRLRKSLSLLEIAVSLKLHQPPQILYIWNSINVYETVELTFVCTYIKRLNIWVTYYVYVRKVSTNQYSLPGSSMEVAPTTVQRCSIMELELLYFVATVNISIQICKDIFTLGGYLDFWPCT